MTDLGIRTLQRAAAVGTAVDRLKLARAMARVEDPDERKRIPLPEGYDETNAIVISASQVELFELCNRKWLGEKSFHLLVPEKGFLSFGTTTHGVCERYLKANDYGYGLDGKAVDLYPQGWDAEVSKLEADLIQKLVDVAIRGDDKGQPVLQRRPGRKVEHGFLRELVVVDGITVFITGWIDYMHPGVVEDHKTAKNLNYSKNEKADSERFIGKSRQMLIYARELLVQAEEAGEFPPDEITVRHNIFVKDMAKPRVKVVQAKVTVQQILAHWEGLKLVAADMVRARHRNTDLNYWHEFPLPKSQARACEAFGGCAYRTICGGLETPFRYMTRQLESVVMNAPVANVPNQGINGSMPQTGVNVVGMRKMPTPPAPPTPPRIFNVFNTANDQTVQVDENAMRGLMQQFGAESIYCLLSGENAQAWKQPADYGVLIGVMAPLSMPTPPAPPQQPVQHRPAPPWFMRDCTACGTSPHPGFNTNGNPCRICYGRCAQQDHPVNFDITADGAGNVTWARKQDAPATPAQQQPMPAAASTPTIMPTSVAATIAAAADVTPEQFMTSYAGATGQQPASAPVPTAPPAEAPKRRGPGRPPKAVQPQASPPPAPAPLPAQATQPAQGVTPAPIPQTAPQQPQASRTGRSNFVLLIGCFPSRVEHMNVIDLSDVLEKWSGLLAQERGVSSHYLLDTFERRNIIASKAAQIASELDGFVFATRAEKGSDVGALAAALRPYACDVIEAAA